MLWWLAEVIVSSLACTAGSAWGTLLGVAPCPPCAPEVHCPDCPACAPTVSCPACPGCPACPPPPADRPCHCPAGRQEAETTTRPARVDCRCPGGWQLRAGAAGWLLGVVTSLAVWGCRSSCCSGCRRRPSSAPTQPALPGRGFSALEDRRAASPPASVGSVASVGSLDLVTEWRPRRARVSA